MQDLETPRMLFRAGGPVLLESGAYTTRIVADQAELSAALADGWHLDQYAAKAAAEMQANAGEMQAPASLPASPEPAPEAPRVKRPYNRKAVA